MVLESLINSIKAEEHPGKMFFYGFVYFSIAVVLSMWIFPDQSSLLAVFFTTIAAVPLMYNTIRFEEKKDLSDMGEGQLLKEHKKAISLYLFMFLGIVIATAIWFIFLPENIIYSLFKVQSQTITEINSNVVGNVFKSFSTMFPVFTKILSNNLKVLIFCILFSFLYGVGALFILTWNASVIGVAIGSSIKTAISKLVSSTGTVTAIKYFEVYSIGFLKYSIHGIPEILSYLVAALAGGIISVAVIKHDLGSDKFEKIILDSSTLILISLIFVLVAAFLEVYVTPYVFYGA